LLVIGLRREWFFTSMLLNVLYLLTSWIGMGSRLAIYTLPVAMGIGLCVQALVTLRVYKRHGIIFSPAFIRQSFVVAAISILIVLSILWPPLILLSGSMYVGFVYRYRLIHEIRDKLYEFGTKTPA